MFLLQISPLLWDIIIGLIVVGFLIGQTIASYLEKPLLPCNHLYGHLYASLINDEWHFPVLGLLVSGGHTQLLLAKKHLNFVTLGQTLDDAVVVVSLIFSNGNLWCFTYYYYGN